MPQPEESTTVLHPASGVLILGLDWVLFSGNAITLGLSTAVGAAVGFVVGGLGIAVIQRIYGGDSVVKALLKALLAGITVGLPLPVAGTAVGGGVLALSGLNSLWSRSDPEQMSPPSPPDKNA